MSTVFLIGNGFDLSCGMKTRYSDMYKEYCKYSKLLELATTNRIKVIKETVRYMYSEKVFENAQKWIHMSNDENLDKRKKYKEKEDFEYLQNILREEILKNSTVNINGIWFEGYEKYLQVAKLLDELGLEVPKEVAEKL